MTSNPSSLCASSLQRDLVGAKFVYVRLLTQLMVYKDKDQLVDPDFSALADYGPVAAVIPLGLFHVSIPRRWSQPIFLFFLLICLPAVAG